MATEDRGRPLPKFGEWDVNNPASADGFTVIFAKARDEKKGTTNGAGNGATTQVKKTNSDHENITYPQKKWFCCF